MDLQGMRDYVRTYLDVDSEELPDVVLNQFLDDGYQRIIKRDRKWPWLQKTWSFATVASVGSYTLSSVGSDINEITSVMILGMPITWSGQADDEAQFALGAVGTANGRPINWSWWGGSLYLWPVPDIAYTVTVRGFRTPTTVVGQLPGMVPDIPLDLHSLMTRYAISCAYAQQDDPEMASFNKQMFEDELTSRWHSYTQIPSSTPLVLNSRYSGALTPEGRLRYPFD